MGCKLNRARVSYTQVNSFYYNEKIVVYQHEPVNRRNISLDASWQNEGVT
jgi:hypothetical protein